MPLVPREKIDDVRERTNIVEVVKRHVDLKRAGTASFKGLCPFHAEKTPSFHVNEQRQFFHCFGCGEKGDVFKFLEKIEQRSFMEVLRDLARQAAVELPAAEAGSAAGRRALMERESERERMLRVVETAAAAFERCYQGEAGGAARSYVEGRGISERIRARFRVGYAPGEWHALQNELSEKKLPAEVAEALGLLRVKDGRRYDFFRNRVMLPVIDHRGHRVVGFSARSLDPGAKEAKYINSSESPLFAKKRELYGLFAAHEAIRKSGTAVVVEGNFDVMSLHEAGLEEAVAPMGTALTIEHIQILSRMAQRIVVVFDGDDAGARAAGKAVSTFIEANLDGRIAHLPPGLDPDAFVRARGVDALRRIVDAARPALDQLIDDIKPEESVPGRMRALEAVVPLLAQVADPMAREMYVGRLAVTLRLGTGQIMRALRSAESRRAGTPPRVGARSHAGEQPPGEPVARRVPPRDEMAVLDLLAAHPGTASECRQLGVGDLLVDPGVRAFYRSALEAIEQHGALDVPAWLDGGPADVRDSVAQVVLSSALGELLNPGGHARALVGRLRRARIDSEIAMNEREHHRAVSQGDEAAALAIRIRILDLVKAKQGLVEAPQGFPA